MSRETSLWARLRDNTKSMGLFMRIENSVGSGMADVNYVLKGGHEGWIELKHAPLIPPRSAPFTRFRGLNDDQVQWHMDRAKINGRSFIMAQVGHVLLLVKGGLADKFNAMMMDELLAVAVWSCTNRATKPQDWERFREVLKG